MSRRRVNMNDEGTPNTKLSVNEKNLMRKKVESLFARPTNLILSRPPDWLKYSHRLRTTKLLLLSAFSKDWGNPLLGTLMATETKHLQMPGGSSASRKGPVKMICFLICEMIRRVAPKESRGLTLLTG